MPIFAGLVSAFFLKLFEVLSARLAYNVSIGLALAATLATAYLVLKAGLAAIWAGTTASAGSVIAGAFLMVLPENTASVVGSLITVDVISSGYHYWRSSAGLVMGAASR